MTVAPATGPWTDFDLFNPSSEHALLRAKVRQLVHDEVEPQAREHDRAERFNLPLLRRCGELDLLGLTVPADEGGAGMDAIAVAIVHEEVATSDPGFALAYMAHTIGFANNVTRNAISEQRRRHLPRVLSGEWVGGMAMSEPEGGTDVLGCARRRGVTATGTWSVAARCGSRTARSTTRRSATSS